VAVYTYIHKSIVSGNVFSVGPILQWIIMNQWRNARILY